MPFKSINALRICDNPEGRATPGRMTVNVGFVTAAYAVSRLLHLALVGLIGHLRGFEGVGYYAVATAIGAAFVFATDLGLSPRLTRILATRSPDGLQVASGSMGAKICMSLIAFPVLAFIPVVISLPMWAVHLCLLLLVASIFDSLSFLCYAVTDGYERVDSGAAGSLVQTLVWVGTAAALIVAGFSLTAIGWAAVAGSVAEFLFSLYAARRFLPITVARPRMKDLYESLPFAVTSLTSFCVWQIDVVLVSIVASTSIAGEYASVSRLLLGIGFVPLLISSAMLPSVTISFMHDSAEVFRALITSALRMSFIISGALFLLLFCAGKQIMTLVYGYAFSHLYMPLAIGAIFIFFRFVSSALACALTASGRQKKRALSMIAGLALTCAAIFILFPLAGVAGGVLALIAGECVYAVFVIVFGWRSFDPLLSLRSLAIVAVGALSGAGLSLLVGGGFVAGLAAALVAYLCLLWLAGELGILLHPIGNQS
jgi:O-antigen/teichoic acid export membrane protein